jgi:23S rRNA (guanosine2251-2'-O)-methyltransferase
MVRILRRREGSVLLYGWHTVVAALNNPAREIRRLLATRNAAHRLAAAGIPLRLDPELVSPETIAAALPPDAVHQGILAYAEPLSAPEIEDLSPEGAVVVLDQVTDPHNVGAILRSAAAFGARALITTARHSPEASGVLAKAASGALEYVPLVTVTNLARGLRTLRENGFQLIGLDSGAAIDLEDVELSAPVALVLGAEGRGLRHLTRETCDTIARLAVPGSIKSLNVSNAAALGLYILTRRLRGSGST